ncbi:hypothetical protein LZ554_001279 [Drepanopeziza brunnea f. sp. 'monogermtubi']|nr:hypothetical protein LZ554_001279 [Drepanopeziza brunnea f. sp. 'monogermtubi']
MMDIPPEKRPRLSVPNSGQWHNSPEASRQLPPPPPSNGPPYQPHSNQPPNPFSRPPEPHPLDLRRPSEQQQQQQQQQQQYDHQDSRRPGSGPSHGYQNGPPPPHPPPYAGHRDPMVKRDPSDEPPQPYRPSSTGADHNVNPSPHHDGHVRPPYVAPYDPARNQQYPPQPYPQPIQSPMSATEPYHPSYGAPGLPPPQPGPPRENPYSTVSYPLSTPARQDSNNVRKKAQRAAQACDSCRTLKAKCDEGRPSCSTCKEKQQECRYRDPPPKQQDKGLADIMEFLISRERRIDDRFEALTAENRRITEQLRIIAGSQGRDVMRFKEENEDHLAPPPNPVVYSQPSLSVGRQILPESPYASTPSQPMAMGRFVENQEGPLDEVSEEEEDTGPPGPAKPPSIPVNHTTGAAGLLGVPAIKVLCADVFNPKGRIRSEKYPILQEEKRGLLRLFGRGEGYEHAPGYDREALVDHDGTPGDSHSDISSPAGEEWGQSGGFTPPPGQAEKIRGNIGADGMPDLSKEKVYELVQSYLVNMNILHPILIPSKLHQLVEKFLRSIPDSHARPKQVSSLVAGHTSHPGAGFVGSYKNPESPGNKRKRSPVSVEYTPELLPRQEFKPGHPFRTIGSAIVLLVMALGEICKHKEKIPDVWQSDRESHDFFGSSPINRNGHPPSPLQSSPSVANGMGFGAGSPPDAERNQSRSRRSSVDGHYPARGFASKARNIDVIPGLAYHALATDVIGNQLGGHSLQHVHANLLAGLYHGQLARVMESHGYIANACRALQVILRPKLERLKRYKIDNVIILSKDNPIVIAFWTCLQLESDIVAELPCPHSGILTFEEDMPPPNMSAMTQEDDFDENVLRHYMKQIMLRKHLNHIHSMFYKPDNGSNSLSPTVKSHKVHHPTIEANMQGLDEYVQADNKNWAYEVDEPAKDILTARLRAKYFGAKVITYRHYVLKFLERSSGTSGMQAGEFFANVQAPVVNPNASRIEDFDPKAVKYAEAGIKALIQSTTAFYGLGDPTKERLIVTNVWGTAHAQWGNMVTLHAAYMDVFLRPMVLKHANENYLRMLTEKTIGFLRLNSTPSSALHSDIKILMCIAAKTGLMGPSASQGPGTNSSFSSVNTGETMMSGY